MTMTDRTDACRLEQAAEEYAKEHFLNDADTCYMIRGRKPRNGINMLL